MKKIFLTFILFQVLLSAYTQIIKEDMMYGTYQTHVPQDSINPEQYSEQITLSGRYRVSYRKSYSYKPEEVKRRGRWKLSGGDLSIEYRVEWLQPFQKIRYENVFIYLPTQDSTITRAKPFTIIYKIYRKVNSINTLVLCPEDGGKCLIARVPYTMDRLD